MSKIKTVGSIVLVLSLLFSCSKNEKNVIEIPLNLTGEMLQVNTQAVIQDQENPINYYSSVDSIAKYGYGYRITLPDSLKEKNLKVIIEAKVKETESITGGFVVSINEANMNNLLWETKSVKDKLNQLNTWLPFKDSVLITSGQNKKQGLNLFIFNVKLNGQGVFSVDDFRVKIIKY